MRAGPAAKAPVGQKRNIDTSLPDEERVLDGPQPTASISVAILIVAKLVNVSDTA
jgi:hypothetical protein